MTFIKKYLLLFIIGAGLTLLIILTLKSWLANKPEYRFGTDRAAVIKQIELLSRWETASYSIDKVIEVGTNYDSLKQFLIGDKLLLVAHGKVIAGLDLSSLQAKDFIGSGSAITINLPAPLIFNTILDNTQTRVFDRNQGLLTKGDLNLEAEARQKAESSIKDAACQGGILLEAAKNAEQQLKIILKSSGFESITIIIPSGFCN